MEDDSGARCRNSADGDEGHTHRRRIQHILEQHSRWWAVAIGDLYIHVPLADCAERAFVGGCDRSRGCGLVVDEAMAEARHVTRRARVVQVCVDKITS